MMIRQLPVTFLHVLRANVVIFLYTVSSSCARSLRIDSLPALHLSPCFPVSTLRDQPESTRSFLSTLSPSFCSMGLRRWRSPRSFTPSACACSKTSQMHHFGASPNPYRYDDVLALFLALLVIPLHMFWCLGSPSQNWAERRLARHGRLPAGIKVKHGFQLALLYFYLFLLFLISMYSSSATLQVTPSTFCRRPCFPLSPPVLCLVPSTRAHVSLRLRAYCPYGNVIAQEPPSPLPAGLRLARGLPPQWQVVGRVP